MKFTIDWLKQHLDTDLNDKEIINNLTNVGLEVESFENAPSELDDFIVAKILNAQQHPNADRLRVCDVDIGKSETCLLYTSPSPRDQRGSRMPSSA